MNTIKLNFYFLQQICIFYLGCCKRCVSFFLGVLKKRQMSWQAYVLSYWQTWEYSSPSLKPSHSIKNNRTKNRKIYLKRERFQNPSSRIALYHNVYFSNLDELFTFWISVNDTKHCKNAAIPRIPGIPGIPGITVTSQGRHRELLGQLIKNERHKLWNQIYIHNREKQTIKVARKTNLPTEFCPLLFWRLPDHRDSAPKFDRAVKQLGRWQENWKLVKSGMQ